MLLEFPLELIHWIVTNLSTNELISLSSCCKTSYNVCITHLYHTLIITNAPSITKTYGSVISNQTSLKLLNRAVLENPKLLQLIQVFQCDLKRLSKSLSSLVSLVTNEANHLKKFQYPLNWLNIVNINSRLIKRLLLENFLIKNSENLTSFTNLKHLTILNNSLINTDNVDIFKNLKTLAIEDSNNFSKLRTISFRFENLTSLILKINCFDDNRELFEFENLNFEKIENLKLIFFFENNNIISNIENFEFFFLHKVNVYLKNVKRFELKRILKNFHHSLTENSITLTNTNYLNFFNQNIKNLDYLKISGNYLSDINDTNFIENFQNIFKNAQKLQFFIIDDFLNPKNSSLVFNFLFDNGNKETREKLSRIASFGYANFFKDSLIDNEFDENIDSTVYDLVKFVIDELNGNFLKFNEFDFSNTDFIKRLHIDFHKRFYHYEKSWKFEDSCDCHENDYKLVVKLMINKFLPFVEIFQRNLKNLRIVVLNGIFFEVVEVDNVKKAKVMFEY